MSVRTRYSFIVNRLTYMLVLGLVLLPALVRVPSVAAQAANIKQDEISQIINLAENHYRKGQDAYTAGDYFQARREFDQALDEILLASIDVRSDDRLRVYYRELIEKVNRYQVASLEQKDGGFNEQRYEPSPLDKIASLSEADLEEVDENNDSITGGFNFHFTPAGPVRQFISYFSRGRGRVTMEAGLFRSSRYREMATRVFKEEGVPTDLIWLAQVESGWNPYALSSAAARGIWQFIPATGQRFGLSQNYWIDERSNPEKSTQAAARYLKWLGQRYKNNWELALAAYNSGEGSVDSALSRSGTADFWQLHRAGYLPHETRNYVPAILAVITIAKNPKKFDLEIPPAYPYRYEMHTVAKQTDLKAVAKRLRLSYGQLLDSNPELQRGVTPPGSHSIRIPASAVKPVDRPTIE